MLANLHWVIRKEWNSKNQLFLLFFHQDIDKLTQPPVPSILWEKNLVQPSTTSFGSKLRQVLLFTKEQATKSFQSYLWSLQVNAGSFYSTRQDFHWGIPLKDHREQSIKVFPGLERAKEKNEQGRRKTGIVKWSGESGKGKKSPKNERTSTG